MLYLLQKGSAMKNEEKNRVALEIIKAQIGKLDKIKTRNADSLNRWVSGNEHMTGIHQSELRRFYRAVITDDVERSFSPKRSGEIARALLKCGININGRIPNKQVREEISEFCLLNGIDFNNFLEVAREICVELVNENLRPDASGY
jgi:hypothetical protein